MVHCAIMWGNANKNLFLESVLLGLPISLMFFADCKDGKQEIIYGVQRIQTLVEFAKGDLQIQGLKKLKHVKRITTKKWKINLTD